MTARMFDENAPPWTLDEVTAMATELRELRAKMSNADDVGGLCKYVGRGVEGLATDLAEAWLVISKVTDGDGKSVRYYPEIPGSVREEWAKMVARRLSGFAQAHERPDYFPWDAREFDQFWIAR